jgi:hypothetical protein
MRWGAVAGLFAVLCWAAPAPAQEDADGAVRESAHYRLTCWGDITADQAGELLAIAEQLYVLLGKHFRAAPILKRGQDKLAIKMWADREAYRAAARADGVPAELVDYGGVYWTGTRIAYFFRQPSAYTTRHLFIHELTHQFQYHAVLRNGRSPVPRWYKEGIAEYFGYHHWDGTTLVCGQPDVVCLETRLPDIAARAKRGEFDPVAILKGDADPDYAEAWALVYYLLHRAEPAVAKRFRALQPTIAAGRKPAASIRTLLAAGGKRFAPHCVDATAGGHITWAIDWRHWDARGDVVKEFDGALEGESKVVALVRTHGRVTADTAMIEATPEIHGGRAGVCAAYGSTNDFVALDCTAKGQARLVRRRGGKWLPPIHAKVDATARPVLKLVVGADGTCTAYVNGTQVIRKKLDGCTPQGAVALLVDGGRSRFHDIHLPPLTHE